MSGCCNSTSPRYADCRQSCRAAVSDWQLRVVMCELRHDAAWYMGAAVYLLPPWPLGGSPPRLTSPSAHASTHPRLRHHCCSLTPCSVPNKSLNDPTSIFNPAGNSGAPAMFASPTCAHQASTARQQLSTRGATTCCGFLLVSRTIFEDLICRDREVRWFGHSPEQHAELCTGRCVVPDGHTTRQGVVVVRWCSCPPWQL